MTRLRSLTALCALARALLIPAAAEAQQQGTVYLNDGSVLSGQVIEFVPGDHITLQIGTAQPIVIPQTNIARVEIGEAATASQPTQPYQPQQQQQAYQPAQQPYQLQQPYQPPARRRPSLGMPITFMAVGGVLAVTGGTLIALSPNRVDGHGYYYDIGRKDALFFPGVALAAAGGVMFSLSVVFLIIRLGQRRRWARENAAPAQPQYGFAPIISPERQLYGLAGTLNF